MRGLILCLTVLLLAAPAGAAERDPAGTIERVQGAVRIAFGGGGRAARAGDRLYLGDTLLTGAAARVRARLRDGSILTLGADGALTLDALIAPVDGAPGGFSVLAGAFRLIAAPTPGARIHTPVATIGIRGTDVWGGSLDGALDVLVLEGAVEVRNAYGSVLLAPGQGTTVDTATTAPTGPRTWPEEKVNRAVDAVAFHDE